MESVTTHHTLVKGADVDLPESSVKRNNILHHQHDPREYKLPKLDFRRFDGEHPRIWRDKCEKYFTMFNVPVHVWVPFALMNFSSNAAFWLHKYEAQHSIGS